ncbi:MAG: TetR/AcrR family transcriptional regulator [Syntrophomonas sp.]|nr:TetR/AcrR family transcriptional regulator [Syntrophomonas sp.]
MENSLNCLTTKEKIIKTTMTMIAEEGLQSITIRKIAAKAGVNVAAVNYHFGCKNAVINESLSTVTDLLKNAFQNLNDDNRDDITNLSMFINEYTDIMFQYPDILKNMINHAIHNQLLDGHVEYIMFLKTEGIELIKATLGRIRPDQDDHHLYIKTLHLVSGLSYPFLMGGQIKEIMGVDFLNPEIRQVHTKMLLESACRG